MVAGELSPSSGLRIRGAFSGRLGQTGGQQSSEDVIAIDRIADSSL